MRSICIARWAAAWLRQASNEKTVLKKQSQSTDWLFFWQEALHSMYARR